MTLILFPCRFPLRPWRLHILCNHHYVQWNILAVNCAITSLSPHCCWRHTCQGTYFCRSTRAPRGTDRSPEYNEHFCHKLDSRVKNLTTEWNQKQQHFITYASRSLLWIRFVAVAISGLKKFFEEGDPPPLVTYFASPSIRPWANMAKTSLCMCLVMSTSSLPSFVNIHYAVL